MSAFSVANIIVAIWVLFCFFFFDQTCGNKHNKACPPFLHAAGHFGHVYLHTQVAVDAGDSVPIKSQLHS